MLFKIYHTIKYIYNKPVFLEPQVIKLYPRSDTVQKVKCLQLNIMPVPFCQADSLDEEGNCVCHVWFEDLTEFLEINSYIEIETLRKNPFDYLINGNAEHLPVTYKESFKRFLSPYILNNAKFMEPISEDPIDDLSKALATEAEYNTMRFLLLLTDYINKTCAYEIRKVGPPKPAIETLLDKAGSCRDLAVLFIEVCKIQGLAARFVSGYQAGAPDEDKHYLHAWAEVFIPGGGWRGYDPTLGIAVSDQHVALVSSAIPEDTTPLKGIFRGNEATSSMGFQIKLVTFE